MGELIEGVWHPNWYDTSSSGGRFVRSRAQFRNWITADGEAGPSGEAGFAAQPGRYHLYVSHACPWAHRTMIFRSLKGLEPLIEVSVVHPHMLEDGWTFDASFAGATGDRLHGQAFLRDVYLRADPGLSARVTVPVLWDRERETIVNNESAEIIRMFNSAFDHLTGNDADFLPAEHLHEIDRLNERIYATVNNGVYRAGFATSQEAYDEAATALFQTLDWLEDRLAGRRYLVGDRITEADWRLFTTLVRFDKVYHTHFKCNRRQIVQYPNLWAWLRELWQWPGVAQTVHFDHILQHYYYSHDHINPHRIVPLTPEPAFDAPHGRDQLFQASRLR
ncbi:glutathione S-transferase family protein [Cereibacter azotoformans]|uniref:Putative glutathione S-transferase n=1 Tax=Cereibacter azotoformans TaxID=43057 RepID=A0A2T5KEK6_9RHOB|nr:glutathione S-transferase family protein [Cereibacter azotoformans]AXQ92544.1 glutathione S-transferase family protein [Cereibacter sphaeroides]MBO4169878.1 glutathione S-transferase family protein [Cereibacter azotoformans]PTR20860.1 putative glutathione S-transferase [Cereibacter azotoformans]UIJ30819.1 glutathione S-transferase family protein [Cereibacter azotoformans]